MTSYLAVAATVLATFVVVAYARKWTWTGFVGGRSTGGGGESHQESKKLWDWLGLLVVPVGVAVIAFALNESQSGRDRAIALDARRDEAVRDYLQRLSDLILERGLLKTDDSSPVHTVARTLTLTVLRQVDGPRRGLIVQFLAESDALTAEGMVNAQAQQARGVSPGAGAPTRGTFSDLFSSFFGYDIPPVDLQGADLRGLRFANVRLGSVITPRHRYIRTEAVDLSGTDLRGADFRGAQLDGLKVRGADLRGADFTDASLDAADFERACLTGARFVRAHLMNAGFGFAIGDDVDFSKSQVDRADLTHAQLSNVRFDGVSFKRPPRLPDRWRPVDGASAREKAVECRRYPVGREPEPRG